MVLTRPHCAVADRHPRWVLAAVVVAGAALLITPAAAADGSSQGGSLADRAAALTSQIAAEDLQADQLSEQVDAARIQIAQIAARLATAQSAVAATNLQLGRTTSVLRQQAVAAYVQDGQPITYVPGDIAHDPALIEGYASSVAGVQQTTLNQYLRLRDQQAEQTTALAAAEAATTASAEQLTAAQSRAQSAAGAAQATLTQVQGQATLAALVTQDQATQAAQTAQTVAARYGVTNTGTPVASAAAATASPTTASTSGTRPVAAAPAPGTQTSPAQTNPAQTSPAQTGPAPTRPAPTPAPVVTTVPRTTTTTSAPAPSSPTKGVPAGAGTAIAWAEAQIGKPYAWGGAGPASFDCSGLVMDAWQAAGVSFPHSSQSQYDETQRVAISALQPGDLVFFGTPSDVYHVGIYVGGGQMVDAPHTGAFVRVESIYWGDLLSGGRV